MTAATASVVMLVVPKRFRWAKSSGPLIQEDPNAFVLEQPSKAQFAEIVDWLERTTGKSRKNAAGRWAYSFSAQSTVRMAYEQDGNISHTEAEKTLYGITFSVLFFVDASISPIFKLRFSDMMEKTRG